MTCEFLTAVAVVYELSSQSTLHLHFLWHAQQAGGKVYQITARFAVTEQQVLHKLFQFIILR